MCEQQKMERTITHSYRPNQTHSISLLLADPLRRCSFALTGRTQVDPLAEPPETESRCRGIFNIAVGKLVIIVRQVLTCEKGNSLGIWLNSKKGE